MAEAVPAAAVLDALKQLSHDIRDLGVGSSVDIHHKLPVVQFLREYVAENKPVVLTSVIGHWPALTKWTDEYLCSVAGDTEVTVAMTPNGRADAVTPLPVSSGRSSGSGSGGAASAAAGASAAGASAATGKAAAAGALGAPGDAAGAVEGSECFALPHQRKMPLREFLALLHSTRQQAVEEQQQAEEEERWQQQQKQQQRQQGRDASSAVEAGAHEPAAAAAAAASVPAVVPYLQYQNSSLTAEVPQLLGDVDVRLSWADEAFGGPPEAVNLWIGDERSITSWHKDPFENIYAEVYRMRLRRYCLATYEPSSSGGGSGGGSGGKKSSRVGGEEGGAGPLAAQPTGGALVALQPVLDPNRQQVLWSAVQPGADMPAASMPATAAAAGLAVAAAAEGNATTEGTGGDLFSTPSLPPPLRVTVRAGETLYLPAMWWHQVEQAPDDAGRAIAVNYWYDMRFDASQAYLQAVERLAQLLGLNEAPPLLPAVGGGGGGELQADPDLRGACQL